MPQLAWRFRGLFDAFSPATRERTTRAERQRSCCVRQTSCVQFDINKRGILREKKNTLEFRILLWSLLHLDKTCLRRFPQWGAADAEIKVPSSENTELKRSPFKAWSRSVCSHTCYAYCQGFLPCLFLPFRSTHLHFFQTSPDFFLS